MRYVAVALALLALQGCAVAGWMGYAEIGIYAVHEDPHKTFALQWMRDTDERWTYPDCAVPVVGVPTWHCFKPAP